MVNYSVGKNTYTIALQIRHILTNFFKVGGGCFTQKLGKENRVTTMIFGMGVAFDVP